VPSLPGREGSRPVRGNACEELGGLERGTDGPRRRRLHRSGFILLPGYAQEERHIVHHHDWGASLMPGQLPGQAASLRAVA
jgi:hypothetical protein